MTHFTIELAITDDRFIDPADLGHNTMCRTIYKGQAYNDENALSEAEKICGTLTAGQFNMDTTGRKYRTWLRHHTLHEEYKFNSSLLVTFRTELFLNACIKAGDEVAQMYRLALEAEGVNLNAKKALKKYHSDYHAYDKKEECLRQLSDMCKRMSVVFGIQASTAPAARYVVYYELPGCEQVSFHTNEPQAQNWPHYDGAWDGKKCSTLGKLENAIWQRYESELTKKYLKD